MKKKNLRLTV